MLHVTTVNIYAPSHLTQSTVAAGAVARQAEVILGYEYPGPFLHPRCHKNIWGSLCLFPLTFLGGVSQNNRYTESGCGSVPYYTIFLACIGHFEIVNPTAERFILADKNMAHNIIIDNV